MIRMSYYIQDSVGSFSVGRPGFDPVYWADPWDSNKLRGSSSLFAALDADGKAQQLQAVDNRKADSCLTRP